MKKVLLVITTILFLLPLGYNKTTINTTNYKDGNISLLANGNNEVDTEACSDDLKDIMQLVKKIYGIAMILAPLGVVIMGSLEFAKAVASQDPDKDTSKAGKKLLHKLIAAAIVLLMMVIVEFIMSLLGSSGIVTSEWLRCWNKF